MRKNIFSCVYTYEALQKHYFIIYYVMTNTVKMTAVGSLLFLTIAGVTFANGMTEEKKSHSIERQAIEQAIDNGDYQSFKSLTEGHKRSEFITEANFHLLDDLHEARKNHDMEKMESIRNEMGLPEHKGKKGGHGNGNGEGKHGKSEEMKEKREEMKEAALSGDFEKFKELSENTPLSDKITEANFSRFQELIIAKENKDFETAKEIATELDLKKPRHGRGNRDRCEGKGKRGE